jgi:hypothetical protein
MQPSENDSPTRDPPLLGSFDQREMKGRIRQLLQRPLPHGAVR